MKTILSILAGALLFVGSVAIAEGMQPDDAIKQNVDKNGAFSICGDSPNVTNGQVLFGDRSAINTPGQGGLHANEASAVTTQPADYNVGDCELVGGETQRIEPPGVDEDWQ